MGIDSNGNQTQASSLDLGSVTVAGIKVGLTQNGIQLIGANIALPSLAILNDLLSSAGVSLQILPSAKTSTSITSEGLKITLTKNLPVEGASEVIVILGQATVQLSSVPGLAGANGSSVQDSAGTTGSIDAGNGGGTTSPIVVPLPTNSPEVESAAPPTPSASAPVTSVPRSSSPDQLITPTYGEVADHIGPDGLSFYLVLMLVGFALIAASRVAGHWALRRTHEPTVASR
ncbi:MAG TPA: hypothetical protein VHV57_20790 [Acidimicrobiales bacterium]|jgi:hypothetical protein|nr:hypothetical protein [Acidimicrobiales bacterium]